jgi:hypothetical protein
MMGDDMFTQDKFNRQDKIYSAFRKFASIHNCHVSLVIHPRKVGVHWNSIYSVIMSGGRKPLAWMEGSIP